MTSTLGMFVKYPEPGRVKTRLASAIGDSAAAALYRGFLSDLIQRFGSTVKELASGAASAPRYSADITPTGGLTPPRSPIIHRLGSIGTRRVLAYSPADAVSRAFFEQQSAGRFELWPQPDTDLGTRMRLFFEAFGPEPVVLIGSDSPTLPAGFVALALGMLETADVVLGPATDGGLYLIGLNQQRSALPIFEGIDWSTSRVLDQVVRRLQQSRARLKVLPLWYDIDGPADLDFLRGHLSALPFSLEEGLPVVPATRAALELLPGLDVLADGR